VRFGFNTFSGRRENLGVGNFDLPERGFTQEQSSNTVRVQEAGPIGRRSFINTRLSYNWARFSTDSMTKAPTTIVQDAFNSGGAQQTSDVHFNSMTLASDVDYVRGIHSWRAGLQIDGQWSRKYTCMN
jgi:hypothetical protein